MNNASKSFIRSFPTMMSSATATGGADTASLMESLHQHLVPLKPLPYASYYKGEISLLPFLSDKYLSLLAPILIYWASSLWFHLLDTLQLPFFEKYRLHEPAEIAARNRVSAKRVIVMVLFQQVVQTILGIFVLEGEETVRKQVFADHEAAMANIAVRVAHVAVATVGFKNGAKILQMLGPWFVHWLYWWGIPAFQLGWAFLVMDAWQYFLHRAFHESRFLYKHFHSHHHRLYVPYAFGALYNHPFEGLLLDSAGGAVAHAAAFMTVRQGILLFTFSTMKTVADHGGYAFPPWLDPLHLLFPNTAEYHDVHHQMQGLRYNYSQPYFVHFDILFGTRMSAEKFAKMRAVNDKLKREKWAVDKAANGAEATVATGAAGSATKASTRRRIGAEGQDDVSPGEVARRAAADGVGDITTTLDQESYRGKAGVAT